MLWRSPAGYFEEDPEYDIGNSRQILPSPGTYTIMIYEYCATCPVPDAYNVFGTDAVVTKLHGNQHNFASLNFAGPVATPEPSVWMLCLAALAAFSWLPMRSFVGRGITVLR